MANEIMHHTSANMDGEFYDQVIKTAILFNIDEEKIFKDLISIVQNSANWKHVLGKLTEYQDHSPERWETFYFSLNEEEIETFSVTRQKYKISISKLAFMGFLLFWEILLFRYSERLKKSQIKINFNSYIDYYNKFKYLAEKFQKRLDLIQKE